MEVVSDTQPVESLPSSSVEVRVNGVIMVSAVIDGVTAHLALMNGIDPLPFALRRIADSLEDRNAS